MSEFDKEAEREKLREQLEAEQADREATQRMSELLLGGATMTGKHCGNCASPIFRQDGREFCPSCNQVVGETQEAQDDQVPGETPDGPAVQADGRDDRTVDAAGTTQPRVEPTESIPDRQPDVADDRQPDASREPTRSAGAGEATPSEGVGEVAVAGDGDLAAAQAALTRKLNRLAAQAEATDDVGRARELLAATREAAEALAALEQIGDSS